MRQFLSLPTSLLLLIAATSALSSSNELQWPYNLPKEARYYPEDEPLIRRDVEISQRLLYQKPLGMRKMSDDEGEKFFMEYWLFDEGTAEAVMDRTDPTETVKQRLRPNKMLENVVAQNWVNESLSCAPRPAFPFHFDKDPSIDLPILGRHFRLPRTLERRDFQCPDGTSACTSINRPDSCCAAGETCQLITNTGLGDVGCCTDGQTCSSQLSSGCDDGLTSCPNYPGGGCCIPGYECLDVGCVYISTATIVVTPTATVTTKSSSSSESSSPPPSTRISTSTKVVVVPPPVATTTSTPRTTSSIQRPSSTCTSGFQSCPASLGGGCCATDMICGTSRLCFSSTSTSTRTSTTTTEPVAPPFRPTSNSPTTSSSQITIPGASCPTNFYACSAFYRGGCCHTGRNCDTTSCPPIASTTVVNTNGVTAVAPTGSGISANQGVPTGTCHNGWITCAADLNGGCCPSGYACGTATCSPTASGGGSVGKDAPSGGEGRTIGNTKALVVGLMAVGVGILLS